MSDDFIPVVAAVVVRDRRLLLCQRHDGPHLPLLWEFPGGKVDQDETPVEALARELDEELGVLSEVGPLFSEVRHRYPEKSVWIRFYATAIRGRPRPRVHRRIRWIGEEELDDYDVPPANTSVLRRLRREGLETLPTVR